MYGIFVSVISKVCKLSVGSIETKITDMCHFEDITSNETAFCVITIFFYSAFHSVNVYLCVSLCIQSISSWNRLIFFVIGWQLRRSGFSAHRLKNGVSYFTHWAHRRMRSTVATEVTVIAVFVKIDGKQNSKRRKKNRPIIYLSSRRTFWCFIVLYLFRTPLYCFMTASTDLLKAWAADIYTWVN